MHLFRLCLVGIFLSGTAAAQAPSDLSILFVVDNSPSMKAVREKLASAAPAIVDKLRTTGVKTYRIAVTSTDAMADHGKLLGLVESSAANPAGDLAALVRLVQDTPTSFWEQGLESSRLALTGPGSTAVGSSRVDLQACKLEYSIVSPK